MKHINDESKREQEQIKKQTIIVDNNIYSSFLIMTRLSTKNDNLHCYSKIRQQQQQMKVIITFL